MAPETVITTGIDRLMDYIGDRDAVEVREAAEALGTDRGTIITWANALEDAGLIEIRFSARKGRVLEPVVGRVSEEKMEEVRKETAETVAALKELQETEAALERFESLLDRIEDGLADSEHDVETFRAEMGDADIAEVRESLEHMEAAETDIEDVREQLEAAIAGVKLLEKMAENREPDEPEPGLLARVRARIPFIGGNGGGDAEPDGPDATEAEGGETFKCGDCGKEFETRHGLETHRGIKHGDRDT